MWTETTIKVRFRCFVPKAHWFQGPAQAESETQCCEWPSRPGLGAAFPESPHHTRDMDARQGLGGPRFTPGHLSVLVAWSQGENPLFGRHVIYCAASSQSLTPDCFLATLSSWGQ